MDAICSTGSAPDAAVAAVTQAALVAWAEVMVRGDPLVVGSQARNSGGGGGSTGSGGAGRGAAQAGTLPPGGAQQAPAPPRLRMGVDSDGNIVAGLADWDAASRLFSSAQQARQLLAEGARKGRGGGESGSGGTPPDFTVRLKNFQLLWGEGGAPAP